MTLCGIKQLAGNARQSRVDDNNALSLSQPGKFPGYSRALCFNTRLRNSAAAALSGGIGKGDDFSIPR
jgi:hypothetical protein